jgi:cholesterol oxidase
VIYDQVIIGSGFGGSVMACRLANAGRQVLVLERGREWTPESYPRDHQGAWIWNHTCPEKQNGWIDFRMMDQMWVAQGAGVGGGSLIYANVSLDADPSVFDDGWPAAINGDVLAPYYAMVGEMLGVYRLPENQWTERTRLMKEAAIAIGEGQRFRPVELAVTFDDDWRYDQPDAHNPARSKTWINPHGKKQGTCIHCGYCDIGCQVHAKNTLDLNYLASARNAGAVIQPLSLVTHLKQIGDHWRVHYDRLVEGRRVPEHVDAKEVILAAGSLGSTELLLRCRDQYRTLPNLPNSLGHGWSSNGDFLTPALYTDRKISPTVGPTISSAIDFLDGPREHGGGRFFVEDGGFPNILTTYITARLKSAPRFSLERRFLKLLAKSIGNDAFANVMPWFGQAVDGADGKLYLGRRWVKPWQKILKLDWNPMRSETGVGGMVAMHEKLSRATGGTPLVPATWTVLRQLVTPHPLGGCNMATGPAAGVVDNAGRVFGHKGLYVLDGAIVPRPIGLNPSKTIAALAERAADLMIKPRRDEAA